MDGMTKGKIALSQSDKTVVISKLVSDDPLLFELFDRTPAAERADMLSAVLHIGAVTTTPWPRRSGAGLSTVSRQPDRDSSLADI